MPASPPTSAEQEPETVIASSDQLVTARQTTSVACPELPADVPDRYRVKGKLGSGAFGDVYLATDNLLERDVCIKILKQRGQDGLDPKQRRHWSLHEARAAARLTHPNIVTVYDVLELRDGLGIVMEYIKGETLNQRLDDRGQLDMAEALKITTSIARALQYAHTAGVVHRDLKPANIFLTHDGEIKLGDFGTAQVEGKPALSSPDLIVGTPAYMSPEQIHGLPVDGRSDIFSLGCLLYELLGGNRPFRASTLRVLLLKIVSEDPPPLPVTTGPVAQGLESFFASALAKDPEQRLQTMTDVIKTLGELAPVGTEPPRQRATARTRLGWGAAAGALLLVLLSLLGLCHRARQKPVTVVVVPFENHTGQRKNDFIAAGFSSELGSLLQQIGGVSIVPFADLGGLLDRAVPLIDAASRAGASFVVQGSLTRGEGGLFLEYSLLDSASSEAHGETYPVAMANLQSSVQQVEGQLFAWLRSTPGARAALVSSQADHPGEATSQAIDPQAYELYLRGISKTAEFLDGRAEALAEARALLERALLIEPSAEVCSGLAMLHFQAVNQGIDISSENLDRCKYYLDKGLALSPDYLPLLNVKVYYLYQRGQVTEALQLAAEQLLSGRLDISLITKMALSLRQTGNYAPSVALWRYALQLHPQNYVAKTNLARTLFEAGEHQGALVLLREVHGEYPSRYWPRYDLAKYLMLTDRLEEGMPYVDDLSDSQNTRLLKFQLARLQGQDVGFAPEESLLTEAAADFDASFLCAESYALAGELKTALTYLQMTLDHGWTAWGFFDWNPLLDQLRQTQQYRAMREQGLRAQAEQRRLEDAAVKPVMLMLGIEPDSQPDRSSPR